MSWSSFTSSMRKLRKKGISFFKFYFFEKEEYQLPRGKKGVSLREGNQLPKGQGWSKSFGGRESAPLGGRCNEHLEEGINSSKAKDAKGQRHRMEVCLAGHKMDRVSVVPNVV